MNYIKEINAFYQRQETNPLSAHAANLWHTLMHVNNRAGWKKQFTVAVSVLCCKGSLSNSTFKRARTELRDKGYIHYESQRGNQSAIYEMIASEGSTPEQSNDQNKGDEKVQTVGHVGAQKKDSSSSGLQSSAPKDKVPSNKVAFLDHKAAPLLKLKETKQRTTTTAADAIDFFRENFQTISSFIVKDVVAWVREIGESLVITAMKRTLERGKENWGYCKGILRAWLDKGIKTVEEADAEVFVCKNKPKPKRYDAAPLRGREVLPDWFKNRHEKQSKSPEHPSSDSVTEARKREEVEKIIAKYA